MNVNQIAQWWWTWTVSMAWQVGLLVVIIASLDLLIRRWIWPQVRYALWFMILVKLILPPGLHVGTGVLANIPFWPAVSSVHSQDTVSVDMPVSFTIEDVLVGHQTPSTEKMDLSKTRMILQKTEQTYAVSSGRPVTHAEIGLHWQVYAGGVWVMGVALLSLWLMCKLRALRQESRASATQALPESFFDLAEHCAHRMGLRHVPEIRATTRLTCPAVTGLFRPVLLMPVGFLSKLSRKDTEHMLLHEFAHIRRGDMMVHAMYLSLQILYWYNPLLWWVGRRMFHLREICCDATVAGLLKEKTMEYRRTLLEIAHHTFVQSGHPGLGLLGLFEDSNRLQTRLNWLKKETWRFSGLRWTLTLLVVLGMGVFILPMAQAQEHSDAKSVVPKAEASAEDSQKTLIEAKIAQLMAQQKQLEQMMQQIEAQKAQLEKMQTPPSGAAMVTVSSDALVAPVPPVPPKAPVQRIVTMKERDVDGKFEILRSEIHTLDVTTDSVLSLKNAEGSITVKGVDSDQYQLMAHIKLQAATKPETQALSKQIDIKTQPIEQGLVIMAIQPEKCDPNQSVSIDYTLLVPKQMNLNLFQADGKISVDGVTGQINLKQEDGEIQVTHASGKVNIILADGEIACENVNVALNILLEDGEIRVKQSDLSSCHIRLEDGEVACEEITGSVDIAVQDGEVGLVYGDLIPASATIEVRVEDGDIKLTAPAWILPKKVTSKVSDGAGDDAEDEDEEGAMWTGVATQDGKQVSITLKVGDGDISVEKK